MDILPAPLPADPACELFTSRLLRFAPDKVHRAWTDAALLSRWWGPHGFSSTFHVFEPCPGGEWRHVMHGPDGRSYDNFSIFRVMTPPRIELVHVSEPRFDLIVTLDAEGESTRMTFLQRFPSATIREALAPICGPANEQNLDRLEQVLAQSC